MTCVLLALVLAAPQTTPLEGPPPRQGGRGGRGGEARMRAFPPPRSISAVATVIQGSPTRTSMDIVIHPRMSGEAQLRVGGRVVTTFDAKISEPHLVSVQGLKPGSQTPYTLTIAGKTGPAGHISTPKPVGAPFRFVVQGDSHPERSPKMNVPALYERSLQMAADQKPDFFICMGDDFSVSNLANQTAEMVNQAYTLQVPYLGIVAKDAPVFLVNGNHELASKANLDGTPNSLGVLTQNARNRNFPQPAPNGYFSGNSEEVKHIGFLRNYFAWAWGDATFLVIDPYWHSDVDVDSTATGGQKRRDLWDITLGKTQYEWFRKTLSEAKTKYVFVFAHHVLGTGRGGVERAKLYEWGGADFATKRPGWEASIHDLMVKHQVSAFFQGHDHLYAYQVLDGVVYQTTPLPADASGTIHNADAYTSGVKHGGPGQVRVSVSQTEARVELLRAVLPADESDDRKHGAVVHGYSIAPRKGL